MKILTGSIFPVLIVLQSLSCVQQFATPWTAVRWTPLCSAISWSLFKVMSIESVMLSNHFILCHPLLLLLSNFPSIRVFSNELALRTRWLKYWSFSFSHGGGHGNPLQYSCLDNPTDRGAWWTTVHGVTESDVTEVT